MANEPKPKCRVLLHDGIDQLQQALAATQMTLSHVDNLIDEIRSLIHRHSILEEENSNVRALRLAPARKKVWQ